MASIPVHKEYIVLSLMAHAKISRDESYSIVSHIEQEITTTYVKLLKTYKINRNTSYVGYKDMCMATPEYHSFKEFLNTLLPPKTDDAFQNAVYLFWDEFTDKIHPLFVRD